MAFKTRKDRRKAKTGSKAVDKTCWNNGSCIYCRENRLYTSTKRAAQAKMKEDDYLLDDTCSENDLWHYSQLYF